MTTRAKLYIAGYTACTMMLLNVFSKPLHIPETIQWVLILGVFIPLGLIFHYNKRQKQEKLGQADVSDAGEQSVDDARQRIKMRLILMMVLGVLVGLCAPFWLPVTGSTLGMRGDFVCGTITSIVVCLIVGLKMRKI